MCVDCVVKNLTFGSGQSSARGTLHVACGFGSDYVLNDPQKPKFGFWVGTTSSSIDAHRRLVRHREQTWEWKPTQRRVNSPSNSEENARTFYCCKLSQALPQTTCASIWSNLDLIQNILDTAAFDKYSSGILQKKNLISTLLHTAHPYTRQDWLQVIDCSIMP